MPQKFNRPKISLQRAAWLLREMLSYRRIEFLDNEFFSMSEVWRTMAEDNPDLSIKEFKGSGNIQEKKAGVIALGGRATLIVAEQLMQRAEAGDKLANFTLAHELAHLMLDHHEKSAGIKNFILEHGSKGYTTKPPSDEELETNYAAVFFQCGVALLAPRANAIELSRRAKTDTEWTKKAIALCSVKEFQEEFGKLHHSIQRIVL